MSFVAGVLVGAFIGSLLMGVAASNAVQKYRWKYLELKWRTENGR